MKISISSRFAALGTLLLAGALGSQTLSAATIYAGTCATPNKPTIQAAVNASAAGGTVLVCPGTYPEQVTIIKNLTLSALTSMNSDAVIIASPAGGVTQNATDTYVPLPPFSPTPVAAQILVANAGNVQISGITIDGSNNGITNCVLDIRGIYYQNASGQINQVITRNQTLDSPDLIGCQSGQGIFIQTAYATGTANVQVQNTTIQSFQKNGLTYDGPGAQGHIQNNYIMGQGPTTGAAENGIQISDGAQATIQNNVVTQEIWQPDTSSQPYNAAAGILIYSSQSVQIQNNIVSGTQSGIATVSDSNYGTTHNPNGLADKTTISGNTVLNTQIFDAIDVCSNNNSIQNNALSNSTESGVHLDSTCGTSGNNNKVSGNLIAEACAGVLNGGAGNTVDNSNMYVGVVNVALVGNSCPTVAPSFVTSSVTADAVTRRAPTTKGRPTPVR